MNKQFAEKYSPLQCVCVCVCVWGGGVTLEACSMYTFDRIFILILFYLPGDRKQQQEQF